MKSILLNLAAAGLIGTGALLPAKKLNVVATTPDLASIAELIGGNAVDVKALAKPTEDAHFVDPKPSSIVTLNRADMLIDGGAELELGWLPALLQSARNPKIAAGAPGRVSASQGIRLLEIPTTFDRSKGDVHALGNPHFLIDPVNARTVAGRIAAQLSQIDPANAAKYNANLKAFEARMDAKLAEWQKQLAPYAGAKVVTYHKDFPYLAARFKLDVVETLEPKPGIAPSPAHLAEVITTMKAKGAKLIFVQPFQNRKTAETVARQTGATILDLAQQPGAVKGTATYFDMMDYIVTTIADALRKAA
ncbi:MAG TPA: metal ABC transporter substrate-binding protein [Longimicrobiales bacterium]